MASILSRPQCVKQGIRRDQNEAMCDAFMVYYITNLKY